MHWLDKYTVVHAQDAKATNIDIKVSNYGADLIEVSDNGSYYFIG